MKKEEINAEYVLNQHLPVSNPTLKQCAPDVYVTVINAMAEYAFIKSGHLEEKIQNKDELIGKLKNELNEALQCFKNYHAYFNVIDDMSKGDYDKFCDARNKMYELKLLP